MPTKLDIVTAERVVFSGEVDGITVPGVEGELGVLPRHTPLMTTLKPGGILAHKGGEDLYFAISGGFIEVRPDKVVILADAAERADEIDINRAEAARQRAREQIASHKSAEETALAQASLERSLNRLRIAERAQKRKRPVIGS